MTSNFVIKFVLRKLLVQSRSFISTVDELIAELNVFIKLGFKLCNNTIIYTIKSFDEYLFIDGKLCVIGEMLWDIFFTICAAKNQDPIIFLEGLLEELKKWGPEPALQSYFKLIESRYINKNFYWKNRLSPIYK
jgi:hypothetical protein